MTTLSFSVAIPNGSLQIEALLSEKLDEQLQQLTIHDLTDYLIDAFGHPAIATVDSIRQEIMEWLDEEGCKQVIINQTTSR